MAKKAYVGVNGQPHNGTALHVGVNNVPRKVVKGYVGVGGVPKVFWDNTAPVLNARSWDYWRSTAGYISELGVNKTNWGIAYYASVKINGAKKALLVSPSAGSVAYGGYSSQGSVTVDNITWYYAMQGDTTDTTCLLSDGEYSSETNAVEDLVSLIYGEALHENYNTSTYYNPTLFHYNFYFSDTERFIRKIYGEMLWRNLIHYPNWDVEKSEHYLKERYEYLNDHASGLISESMSEISNSPFIEQMTGSISLGNVINPERSLTFRYTSQSSVNSRFFTSITSGGLLTGYVLDEQTSQQVQTNFATKCLILDVELDPDTHAFIGINHRWEVLADYTSANFHIGKRYTSFIPYGDDEYDTIYACNVGMEL